MTRASKRIWPEVGRGFWVAAGLSAAIILTCTLSSLRWLNRPFPGFFLWENLFVPAVGDTDWTGHQAGVPYQSRLLAMNGTAVVSAAEVYELAARLPVGTDVAYSFSSSVAPVHLAVPTMRLSPAEYFWTLGNYLGIGALLTVLGFVVYMVRPEAPAARSLLAAGATWGLYLVTAADIFGPAWFRPLCLMLQATAPIAVLHLALTFPVEREILKRHPRLLPGLYAGAFAVGVLDDLAFLRWFPVVLAITRLTAFAMAVAGAILVGLLVHSFFVPPSAAARQRTKIAALGGLIAFLAPVVGIALVVFLGARFPINLITLPMAVFPVAIGYAIAKHDLFEVDAIIRRTIAWAILTGLIAALYLGGVGTLELLFAGSGGRVAQLLFLLGIVALFNPLRNRVQAGVDFLFARDRYDYRKTVTDASQGLAVLLDLETVVGRMLRTVTEGIRVDFGAVWLRDDHDGYRLQAVAGTRTADHVPARLDERTPLVSRLKLHPRRIITDEDVAERDRRVAQDIAQLGAALVVPMTFERQLTGILALGSKQSGEFYSNEDLQLLRTLTNQGAVAVENARSYRALVSANDQLRAAQSRLIETERLAAIGELSAAVAHGIRNPVAGIRAAAQLAGLEIAADHPLSENLADIIEEADKLDASIKGLLDFAKPFEPHPAPCQVGTIVTRALASLRSQISSQGIVVDTAIDPELPEAHLDAVQIEQVLLCLLSNAVEVMPDGGRLTVTGRLTDDRARIRMEVIDTGPGIPPEQRPRLFKLFFTTKPTGTGFGLAVAKKIVDRHGGTIVVESQPGEGSRFIVELPLVPRTNGLS